MTDDALIEAMARALCLRRGIDPDDALPEEMRKGTGPWPYWEAFVGDADAALATARPVIRAQALEEAAKVADENAHAECDVAEQIAAHIRALKERSST